MSSVGASWAPIRHDQAFRASVARSLHVHRCPAVFASDRRSAAVSHAPVLQPGRQAVSHASHDSPCGDRPTYSNPRGHFRTDGIAEKNGLYLDIAHRRAKRSRSCRTRTSSAAHSGATGCVTRTRSGCPSEGVLTEERPAAGGRAAVARRREHVSRQLAPLRDRRERCHRDERRPSTATQPVRPRVVTP